MFLENSMAHASQMFKSVIVRCREMKKVPELAFEGGFSIMFQRLHE